MEHQVYRVIRVCDKSGVTLTLEDHPSITVTGKSQEDAEEALLDCIIDMFGDGEPVLDYFVDPGETSIGAMWVFRSTEKATTINLAELYDAGVCRRCGVGMGKRKANLARVLRESLKGDVAFTLSGPVLTHIFSERMAKVLIKGGFLTLIFRRWQTEEAAHSRSWSQLTPPLNGRRQGSTLLFASALRGAQRAVLRGLVSCTSMIRMFEDLLLETIFAVFGVTSTSLGRTNRNWSFRGRCATRLEIEENCGDLFGVASDYLELTK